MSGRHGDHRRAVVKSADLLGAFGVGEADVRPSTAAGEDSLSALLDDALRAAPDPTAYCRRTVASAERGVDLPARYPRSALRRALGDAFAAIGWRFDVERRVDGTRELAVTDGVGRTRELDFSYPDTPLGDDNLPAMLRAIDEELLAGTPAGFVLLSAGADRWRAALVNESAVEDARERFGDRIAAFDRPLLPEHGLDAYVDDDGASPWPEWARERADRLTRRSSSIEGFEFGPKDPPTDRATGSTSDLITEAEPDAATGTGEAAPEIAGGGPTVERSAGVEDLFDEAESEPVASDFGTLSGSPDRARVGNDAFGADDVEFGENERYRAFGAAVWAGGDISLSSLLADEAFVPEIPATERTEVRITFDEPDPVSAAGPTADTTEGEDGFVWVGGGAETVRSGRSL